MCQLLATLCVISSLALVTVGGSNQSRKFQIKYVARGFEWRNNFPY
jgi:hypothetical protein